jgi:GNAT superfamily N-acetyltransferase
MSEPDRSIPPHRLITARDVPDLLTLQDEVVEAVWPQFLLHTPVGGRLWNRLFAEFPDHQLVLLEEGTDRVLAAANSIPLAWNGADEELPAEGWDWVMEQGFEDRAAGRTPVIQSALSITIAPHLQGRGLSATMIRHLRAVAEARGFSRMIAPVRPSWKSRYPLTPMERYVEWTTDEGLPFDPWIRTHVRLGARIVGVCSRAYHVAGPVGRWEEWTGLRFPESGSYLVPGGLNAMEIDLAGDRGLYVEPGVWLVHGPDGAGDPSGS